jgi:hypothetical protein
MTAHLPDLTRKRCNNELRTKAKLSITVEGDLADFLGVNIATTHGGRYDTYDSTSPYRTYIKGSPNDE